MTDVQKLLYRIQELFASGAETREESFRTTITGSSLTDHQAHLIENIDNLFHNTVQGKATFLVNGETTPCRYDINNLGLDWRLVLGKRDLSKRFQIRPDEYTVLFFSEIGLQSWLNSLDPFVQNSIYDPQMNKPLTIRVLGLQESFGGPELWVIPIGAEDLPTKADISLPNHDAVSTVTHISSTGVNVKISPRNWALTWGDLTANAAVPLLQLGSLVLAACLAHEVRHTKDGVMTSLRGAKRVTLPLWNSASELPWLNLHKQLIDAVKWIYAERPETRLGLVMDRLTLELQPGDCLVASLFRYLKSALRQAEDSYSFVILERKDAYHKEMRELMKDMKNQADYYAAKTRDMIGALSRDFLGVLIFLAFTFIGKFDRTNLSSVLVSPEFVLFLRFLAGYLALSFALQIASLIRDDDLTSRESNKWLDVLRNYTSSQDKRDNFLSPINSRRRTLHHAMLISGVLYGTLTIVVWHLPEIVHYLTQ